MKRLRKYNIILNGIFLCILFWIVEFILFNEHSFSHIIHEILMRLLIIFLILNFSLYIQYNINKRLKSEIKIRESEERYRKAFNRTNLYKDIFTHDINNILQNLLISSELSKLYIYNLDKRKEFEEATNLIIDQIMRGRKLASNVQKLSQVDENKLLLSPTEVLKTLKETIKTLKENYSYKDIQIKIETLQNEYFINANNLLKTVFENILHNAIEHNQNPVIEILIRILRREKNGINFVKFEFIDNGIGIGDSMKDTIFIRDFKKKEGLGLGLLLVKRILKIYNGEIRVKDKIKGIHSRGSNFIITVPELNHIYE